MMKLIIQILFFSLLVMTNWIYAQTDSGKDAAKLERGQEILNQARKAIDKGNVLQNLKSLYLNVDRTFPGSGQNKLEVSIEMPDKIRVVRDRGNFKRFLIVSGGKYSEDSEMRLNGEMVSMRKLGKLPPEPIMPAYLEEVLSKEKVDYLKKNPDELNKLFVEETLWTDIFPILLFNPLNKDVKYEYVGKAESANQRADIVDVKSNFYRKIRLFFDEKTHLLLMMTRTLERTNTTFTEKYYFSDYQLTNGLLVAKSVKGENDEVFKDGSGKKTYGPFQPIIKEIKIISK